MRIVAIFAPIVLVASAVWAQAPATPQIEVSPARPVYLPGGVDSNSPVWWSGGQMRSITSEGQPLLGIGTSQFSLRPQGHHEQALIDHKPFWIEAVWRDAEGALFGWYHYEPVGVCETLTTPMIGAAFSRDEGVTWQDLGIVMSAADSPECDAQNGYFAGGHGDFSVIPDRAGQFLYFYFGNYGGGVEQQGIAVARMAVSDRWAPAGAVWKYHAGDWREPGLGGWVTPVFAARAPWQGSETDAYWGPSIHWNTWLQSYVILMNHSCCTAGWPQAGVYYTFNDDLANPQGWSEPVEIFNHEFVGGWYPQVIGLGRGETDSVVGRRARFYLSGASYWEVEFRRPGQRGPR